MKTLSLAARIICSSKINEGYVQVLENNTKASGQEFTENLQSRQVFHDL